MNVEIGKLKLCKRCDSPLLRGRHLDSLDAIECGRLLGIRSKLVERTARECPDVSRRAMAVVVARQVWHGGQRKRVVYYGGAA